MKKIMLLFLCLQLLTANAFAEELSKLPLLFMHFNHHKHQGEHLSFLDFVAQHYGSSSAKHHEPDHEHLPLKHCADHCHHVQMAQNTVENLHFRFQPPFLFVEKPCSNYVATFLSGIPDSIFQPPRLV